MAKNSFVAKVTFNEHVDDIGGFRELHGGFGIGFSK